MADISQIKLPDNATYDINAKKVNGKTVESNVPSNAKFTDTNNAVTQTATTTNANYEVLFSSTADNTTRTEGARKNSNLRFNPSTGALQANKLQGINSSGSTRVEFYNDAEDRGRFYLYNASGSSQVEMTGDGSVYVKNASGTANIALTGSNGNINCTTVNNHSVPKITFSNRQCPFTSSTSLTYTGYSLTCPVGCRQLVRVWFRYVNSYPTQVAVSTSSTTCITSICYAYSGEANILSCFTFMLVSGETVYYWAKYSGATANRIDENITTFYES